MILTSAQLSYVKWLCRKNGDLNAPPSESELVNTGKKIYLLKAETDKDAGLLGLFLASLRKNCKGLLDIVSQKDGSYQVEIYDNASSISSFESLLMFWKADKLLVK